MDAETDSSTMTARTPSRPTPALGPVDAGVFKQGFELLVDNVERVVRGKTDEVCLTLVALLCGGHVLFEDVPGTGKSVLAGAIARSLGVTASHLRCTPDMAPSDATGSSLPDEERGRSELWPGPVFANVVVCDDLDRATPRAQQVVFDAMAEGRVTAEGASYELPRPYLVLATQMPVGRNGTQPLRPDQLDRFMFRLSLGYLARDDEYQVVLSGNHQVEALATVMGPAELEQMAAWATTVEVPPQVGHYAVDLVRASRNDPSLALGASTRGSMALVQAARVVAASNGRASVDAGDVRAMVVPVLAHRVIVDQEAARRGETAEAVLTRLVRRVQPPLGPGQAWSQLGTLDP